jgi:hypothetical protein
LSITAGGATSTRTLDRVDANLNATYALQRAILSGSAVKGQEWVDTVFDVMSGEQMVVTTRCISEPRSDRDTWSFVNRDNVIQRDERWAADGRGRTLFMEVAPIFTARHEDEEQRAGAKEPTADITTIADDFIVAMKRAPKAGETIALKLSGGASLRPAVRELYAGKGNEFVLKPMPRSCDDALFQASGRADSALLRPSAVVQSDAPSVRELAARLTEGNPNPCTAIDRINDYLFRNIEKRNVATYSSALETLRAGFGDCGEHSVLLAALLRAAGFPSRVVYGLVFVGPRGGYMYHAWVQVRAAGWLNVDAAMGVFPAWKGYVPLVAGDSGADAVQLANLLGRVQLRYVPASSAGLKN